MQNGVSSSKIYSCSTGIGAYKDGKSFQCTHEIPPIITFSNELHGIVPQVGNGHEI